MTATVGCMFQAILLYEISKCFSNAIQVNQREIATTNWRGKKEEDQRPSLGSLFHSQQLKISLTH